MASGGLFGGMASGLQSGIVLQQRQQQLKNDQTQNFLKKVQGNLKQTDAQLKQLLEQGGAMKGMGIKFEDFQEMVGSVAKQRQGLVGMLGNQGAAIDPRQIEAITRSVWVTEAEQQAAKNRQALELERGKAQIGLEAERAERIQDVADIQSLGFSQEDAARAAFDIPAEQRDRIQRAGTALGKNGERKPAVMIEGRWMFSQTQEPVPNEGWNVVSVPQETDAAGSFDLTTKIKSTLQGQDIASENLIESTGNMMRQIVDNPTSVGPVGWLQGMSNKTLAVFGDTFFFADRANYENNLNLVRQAALRTVSDESRFSEADRDYINAIFPEVSAFESASNAQVKLRVIRAFFLRRALEAGDRLGQDVEGFESMTPEEIAGFVQDGLMSEHEGVLTLRKLFPTRFE